MKLSIGIVGLPNVGKSTLFKQLTAQEVTVASYPFATIDPNVGIVAVPDERVGKLAAMSNSKKKIPAVVEFYDIAGLVRGANKGEGLGNQFLAHIRETQAIVVVVRAFEDANVAHVEGTVSPLRDIDTINAELILKDFETVEKRLKSLASEARGNDKEAIKNLTALNRVRETLEGGELTSAFRDEPIVRDLQLLTAKKQIYLLNGSKSDITDEVKEKIATIGAEYLIADLLQPVDLSSLIQKTYEVLGLISFFTTGEDETRAWTILAGTKAPQAAGVIHTDFEKKFIRAEVIACSMLLEVARSTGLASSPQASSGQGVWAEAKKKGLVRTEGKEYEVQDGDVLLIRHG